jgi:L-malate glycosyltransferase
MRVLWITNTIFPAPSKALGLEVPVTGGWMYGLAMNIASNSDMQLAVATSYRIKTLKIFDIEGVKYYLLPSKSTIKYQKHLELTWKSIIIDLNPDIIHIHGTEFSHGLACMKAFPTIKYVVSIQGLISECSKYFLAGISSWEIFKNITLRDIMKADNIFQAKSKFEFRGRLEKDCLKKVKHVIGRTTWDLVHSQAINPSLNYHFCNESLRESFYKAAKWDFNAKSNYTIFLSQAIYPIKGLHQVLKAVATLKAEFPKIKIRIAGSNITDRTGIVRRARLSGYGLLLLNLIKKYELHELIKFLGPLDEEKMINEYRNAHIFVCPSSIENSPNSLGEAQLLGVPSIAAFVGGIPDMIMHGKSGLLYRFEDIEILAYHIKNIFLNDDLALRLSKGGMAIASMRHDSGTNTLKTLQIYKEILNEEA